MLNWLRSVAGTVAAWLGKAGGNVVNLAIGGIAAIFDLVTGNVSGAWTRLQQVIADVLGLSRQVLDDITQHLVTLLKHLIPRYAMTAWWWVTHPDDLASVLFWYLVKWLEARAWTVGKYLGDFALSLVAHNVKRLALLVEDIVKAVL